MLNVKIGLNAAIVFCLLSAPSVAQDEKLDPIIVNATRVEKDIQEIPAAVSVVGQDEIQLGTEQLGLDESLGGIPGLFMLNRYNFAQDLRASIRGFGARSSFGIRGIKIIVDGIPETLPDGQGSVDGVDIGSASRISVIRGPASSLYGNASGGAILIESEQGPVIPFAEARITFGEFDFNKLQLKMGGDTGKLNYLLNLSDTSIDGYRDHSEYENTQLNGRFEYALSGSSSLLTTIHHTDQPIANDPGGISAASAAADPTQAHTGNVTFDAGEALQRTRVGVLYKTSLNENRELEARIYNTTQDFSNKLPFAGSGATQTGGAVVLDRSFTGGGLKYVIDSDLASKQNRLLLGFDYDRQDDDRSRYNNNNGTLGAQRLNQNELVTSLGTYLQNETKLTDTAELTVGLRYDNIQFDVTDRFLSDASDDSGKVDFDQFSPTAGISIKHNEDTHFYATISQSFETPTTTEFANPSGGGFNQTLEPQEATNYEVGIKTSTDSYRFEAALFHIDVENELVPYQLVPGGTVYFENAGSSSRDGLELSYTRQLAEQFSFSMAYTYSDFVFERFTDVNSNVFDGNQTPGIPEDLLHLDLSWFGDTGFYATWDTLYTGELFAENANQVRVESSSVSNLRLGHNKFYDDWEVSTFLGVNNLFDEAYNSNIRINAAFGGRYFEPAPERNAYIGITLRRRFSG